MVMYYIEKEIPMIKGAYSIKCGVHLISSYSVDFLNKEVVVNIVGYKDWVDFSKSFFLHDSSVEGVFTTMFTKYDKMDFNIDPCLFAIRNIISDESSVFHGCEIKKIYDLSTVRDKYLAQKAMPLTEEPVAEVEVNADLPADISYVRTDVNTEV